MLKLREYGLTPKHIQETSDEKLGELICKVGFWTKKVQFIKKTTDILLEKYDGYVSTDYTADSWAAFYSAYETASAVAQNDDATQDEVDAAVAALERTGAALVLASGSEKPDGSPDNEYNQTEKPADTSASMPIAPYACVTLLAAGAAFVSIRKKRTAK